MNKMLLSLCGIAVVVSFAATNIHGANSSPKKAVDSIEISGKYRTELASNTNEYSVEPLTDNDRYSEILITASTGMQYYITEKTEIHDSDGKNIDMDDLKVPCKVNIEMQILNSGHVNIEKLDVRRVLSGATAEWNEVVPQ